MADHKISWFGVVQIWYFWGHRSKPFLDKLYDTTGYFPILGLGWSNGILAFKSIALVNQFYISSIT
tara:strand:+ start:248627 stop:248824 length:198 start_codon:yes stop_codon:yes gene_type:complete